MGKVPRFLDLAPEYRAYASARFVVIPVPYEATTTYGKGTKNGPAAILLASQQVETFDEEIKQETVHLAGVHTFPATQPQQLEKKIISIQRDRKIPVILGGEHSITPRVVKACARQIKNLSVLQLDAHADLRDQYQGKKHSHACAMRRTLEICPVVQAGIRNLAQEEYLFARRTGQINKIHWAHAKIQAQKICRQLSENVYLSIDVDAFDPGIIPGTGTPEPGGLAWATVIALLRRVCATKKIIGFDVVELAPIKGELISQFAAAKLVYKIMGMIQQREKK